LKSQRTSSLRLPPIHHPIFKSLVLSDFYAAAHSQAQSGDRSLIPWKPTAG
jgi:hypothetical protein